MCSLAVVCCLLVVEWWLAVAVCSVLVVGI